MIIKPTVKLLIYFAIVLFLCGCALQKKDDVRISENSIKVKSNKTNFTTIPLKGTNLENINHGKINIFMNIDSEFSIKNKNRRKLL